MMGRHKYSNFFMGSVLGVSMNLDASRTVGGAGHER
jgi:hypothetical protein